MWYEYTTATVSSSPAVAITLRPSTETVTTWQDGANAGNFAYDVYSAALTGLYVPMTFTITTSKKETTRNDGADNNICYLDRHTVQAPAGQIIMGFKIA